MILFMKTHSSTIIILLAVVFSLLIANWRTQNFDYQCEKCGARFNLQPLIAVFSLHMMGKKFVKCPNCGRWCWVSPIPKE